MNIFISALSGQSVGSIGNRIVFLFFLALRCIAGWYIFSFFTVSFLNQYHSFVSFNHSYSDTWLSFKINIVMENTSYHWRGICHDSRNLEIYHFQCHILKWQLDFDFFCCIFSISCFISRLMIRIWIWLLSEMPFSYIQFLNANPSEVYRPQGSIWKWVIAITCSAWTMYWQENTSKILPFLGMFFFFFDCPHIPLKVDLEKKVYILFV